jgi:hypothetical protein
MTSHYSGPLVLPYYSGSFPVFSALLFLHPTLKTLPHPSSLSSHTSSGIHGRQPSISALHSAHCSLVHASDSIVLCLHVDKISVSSLPIHVCGNGTFLIDLFSGHCGERLLYKLLIEWQSWVEQNVCLYVWYKKIMWGNKSLLEAGINKGKKACNAWKWGQDHKEGDHR